MVLQRLAYLLRQVDLRRRFSRSKSAACCITLHLCKLLGEKYRSVIGFAVDILKDRAAEYTASIETKGALLRNCVAFIYGTVRPACRPSVDQRASHSGNKYFEWITKIRLY